MTHFWQEIPRPTLVLIIICLTACSNWPHQKNKILGPVNTELLNSDSTDGADSANTSAPIGSSASPSVTRLGQEFSTQNLSKKQAKDITAETLSDIILAEMAGTQNRLDVTLGNYVKQAHQTRDPYVIARALEISKYLNANQASLDMANLWISIDPNNIEALQQLSLLMIRRLNFKQAKVYIERLLALKAMVNFDFLVAQASQLDNTKRSEVIELVENLIQQYPTNAQLWFTKAVLNEQNGKLEQALEQINTSLKFEQSSIAAIIFKASILVKQQKVEGALKLLRKHVKRHPENRNIGTVYARLLIQNKQLMKAQQVFKNLLSRNPNDSGLLLALAVLSWENKLNEQAKDYLKQLINKDEKVNEAYFYLAQISTAEGDSATAINYLKHITGTQNYGPAQIGIAELYAKGGDISEARKTLLNARLQQPEQAAPFFIVEAEILARAEKIEEAYQLYNTALSAIPNNTDLLYSRSMLSANQKKFDQMEADLRKILQIDSNHATALNALGYSLIDRNERIDEAVSLIEKADKKKPNDPAIVDSLGWAYYRKGDLNTALHFLQKAYQIMQDHEIAAHLVEVLWASGYHQEAKRILDKAIKINPESDILQKTMQLLIKKKETSNIK